MGKTPSCQHRGASVFVLVCVHTRADESEWTLSPASGASLLSGTGCVSIRDISAKCQICCYYYYAAVVMFSLEVHTFLWLLIGYASPYSPTLGMQSKTWSVILASRCARTLTLFESHFNLAELECLKVQHEDLKGDYLRWFNYHFGCCVTSNLWIKITYKNGPEPSSAFNVTSTSLSMCTEPSGCPW